MELEEFAACATHIAVSKVVAAHVANKSEAKFTDVVITLDRLEIGKGAPPKKTKATTLWRMSARRGEPNMKPAIGDRYLIFFDLQKSIRGLQFIDSEEHEATLRIVKHAMNRSCRKRAT